jgi:CHAT domain-containing protein
MLRHVVASVLLIAAGTEPAAVLAQSIHPSFHDANQSDFHREFSKWASEVEALGIETYDPDEYAAREAIPKLGKKLNEIGMAVLILLADAERRGFDARALVLDPSVTTVLTATAAYLERHRGHAAVPLQLYEIAIEIDRRQQDMGIESWNRASPAFRTSLARRGMWLIDAGRPGEAVRLFDASGNDPERLAAQASGDDFPLFHLWATAIADAGDHARAVKLRRIAFDARKEAGYGLMMTQAYRLAFALDGGKDFAGKAQFMAELLARSDLQPDDRAEFQIYRLEALYKTGAFDGALKLARNDMNAAESGAVRIVALGMAMRILNDRGDYSAALDLLYDWQANEGVSSIFDPMNGWGNHRVRLEAERASLHRDPTRRLPFSEWAEMVAYDSRLSLEELEETQALLTSRGDPARAPSLARVIRDLKQYARAPADNGLLPLGEAWFSPVTSATVAALPRAEFEARLASTASEKGEQPAAQFRRFLAQYMLSMIAASRGDWGPAVALQVEVDRIAAERGDTARVCHDLLSLYPAVRQATGKGPPMPDCTVTTNDWMRYSTATSNAVIATNFDGDVSQALALLAPELARVDNAKISRREVSLGSNTTFGRVSTDRSTVYSQYVELASRDPALRSDPVERDLVFRRLQATLIDDVAEGINRAAAERIAATKDPALVDMLREYQQLAEIAGRMPVPVMGPRTEEEREAARQRAAKEQEIESTRKRRMDEIRTVIDAKFPGYFELVEPEPLGIADIQSRLGEDEALLLIVPLGHRIHQIAIDKRGSDWATGDIDAFELARLVQRLMWDVGAKVDLPQAVQDRWADHAGGGYGYDRGSAYRIYQAAIQPVEARLRGKRRVFVTSSGVLTALPIGILVTSPPEGSDANPDDLRRTQWLADKFAIVNLPSIPSLRLLERQAGTMRSVEGAGFVGFGDPVLAGVARRRGGGDRTDQRARQGSPEEPNAASSLPEQLRRLARLPGTARELNQIRAKLGAPPESVKLAEQALESQVRTADLSKASIIAFATHGLVPGEISGLDEAGLVMTPPTLASETDDGFLSASEIALLKLQAEWVLLSACNTAVAKGYGATSLTDAFFYAGARSVLASHWPVSDDAAALLTSVAIALQKSTPGLSRAEALQLSMRQVRNDTSHDRMEGSQTVATWAHPSIWGPFSIFGDVN